MNCIHSDDAHQYTERQLGRCVGIHTYLDPLQHIKTNNEEKKQKR